MYLRRKKMARMAMIVTVISVLASNANASDWCGWPESEIVITVISKDGELIEFSRCNSHKWCDWGIEKPSNTER